jgi:hypothetical protein
LGVGGAGSCVKGERKSWAIILTRLKADKEIHHSGIFGYVNYLVEKDRKFIIDTLINGTSGRVSVKAA